MSSPIDLDKALKKIERKYQTRRTLLWDERSEDFVESVCQYFKLNDRISDRQLAALVKITKEIELSGKKALYKGRPEQDKPGFLGLNCKTGEVIWHSWQVFERD